MNYLRQPLLDELAARYVLGTMGPLARARFNTICRAHPAARLAVLAWQQRLQPLVDAITPVQPPARIWTKIKREIKRETKRNSNQPSSSDSIDKHWFPWRWATAGLAALVMFMATLLWQQPESETGFAALLDEQGGLAWSLTISPSDQLRVVASAAPSLTPEQRHELWVISGTDGAPVSLGLLPINGEQLRMLTAAQLDALTNATTLAVSIEPANGSPMGAPTGPVILTAPLVTHAG